MKPKCSNKKPEIRMTKSSKLVEHTTKKRLTDSYMNDSYDNLNNK